MPSYTPFLLTVGSFSGVSISRPIGQMEGLPHPTPTSYKKTKKTKNSKKDRKTRQKDKDYCQYQSPYRCLPQHQHLKLKGKKYYYKIWVLTKLAHLFLWVVINLVGELTITTLTFQKKKKIGKTIMIRSKKI